MGTADVNEVETLRDQVRQRDALIRRAVQILSWISRAYSGDVTYNAWREVSTAAEKFLG